MKTIPLTQGKEALVDDCDYEYLMQWKWFFMRNGTRCYARRLEYTGTQPACVLMHHLVAERSGVTIGGRDVDHWDHNGLNNRRANLRVATRSQNNANQRLGRRNKSGFKGVSWDSQARKWRAQICVAKNRMSLGQHDDPRDAARAYNAAALKHFGEFACLNPV